MSTRLYPDRVRVVAADAVMADHERLADRGHVRYDWPHYIELVDCKPGALRNGAPFADLPVPLRQLKLGLLQSCALSAEHVRNVLARLTAAPKPEGVAKSLRPKEAPLDQPIRQPARHW